MSSTPSAIPCAGQSWRSSAKARYRSRGWQSPSQITLAAVVQHLQVLEESGLVQTEKVGRVRTCRIEPAGLSVAAQWIGDRRTTWERRLDRLGDILAEKD